MCENFSQSVFIENIKNAEKMRFLLRNLLYYLLQFENNKLDEKPKIGNVFNIC